MKRLFLFPLFALLQLFATPASAQSNPFNPDVAWCRTQGAIAYRNATKWLCLNPGTAGNALVTQGANANPNWAAVGGTGTVTSVAQTVPSFLSVAGSPVTGSGTLAITANTQNANTVLAGPTTGAAATPAFRALGLTDFPSIASGGILSNVTGGSTTPSANNLSALLDFGISSARGSMAYRSTGGWVALAPGTSGQFLQTAGAGADPTWAAVSGATGGTVTTITAGTNVNLSSGATCTLTCTISSTAPSISNNTVLSNVSGSSAVASGNTLTQFLDSAAGSAQGSVLYRSASAWTVLAPGTSGQVLTTGGAGANPSWATPSSGAWTLLATTVPAGGSPNIDFTGYNLNNYDEFLIEFPYDGTNCLEMASSSQLNVKWSDNNGSSYTSGRPLSTSTSGQACGWVRVFGNKTAMTMWDGISPGAIAGTVALSDFARGFESSNGGKNPINAFRISNQAAANFTASKGSVKLYVK